MSRTFRKNKRWFRKVHGEYYQFKLYQDRSMKTPFPVKDLEELPNLNPKPYMDALFTYKGQRHIVTVADGDNHKRGLGKSLKQSLSQIDRSRAKQALTRAMQAEEFDDEALEDTTPAFNPWDWD